MKSVWMLPMLIMLAALCVGGIVVVLMSGRKAKLDDRIRNLNAGPGASHSGTSAPVRKMATEALPRIGTHLLPTDEQERTRLQGRLMQAGLYGRQAMVAFLGAKLILMVGPGLIGLSLGLLGLLPLKPAAIYGACLGLLGMVGPSLWLDRKKKARQASFRRGLPDALDVIVICVEGGLSLVGALRRVSGDLRAVHPELAIELEIVQREVQLGQTAGEALRRLGERADMEEVRSLASVIIQSERFGAGLNKSLKMHADTLRMKRQQRAEEMAQKAGTKVLFPTLLFIFPAIFVVILGPAMVQISNTLLKLNK